MRNIRSQQAEIKWQCKISHRKHYIPLGINKLKEVACIGIISPIDPNMEYEDEFEV